MARYGLSPRMRGNHAALLHNVRRVRSIPAHAGEPKWRFSRRFSDRVYPRACGGTQYGFVPLIDQTGLSPRMRGNLRSFIEENKIHGSIPAHAGEPKIRKAPAVHRRVYPRACGGTSSTARGESIDKGLSPRMRGNRSEACRATPRGGSIPAHAGEPRQSDPEGA